MRVVFLGNAHWSVPALEALASSGCEVALVATRAPRIGGRGNRPLPNPVAEAALRLGLPLEEVVTVKSGPGFEALAAASPEVLAVVAYGEILPKEVLERPAIAPVNVHFSLLPELRGAAPVQRAILAGLEVSGVTTIRMDEGMDTGPILLQAPEPIGPEEDAGSLGDRLASVGGRLLVETLDGLGAGAISERPQDDARATYAPKLRPEDRVIDWSGPAEDVARRVRAMAPEPGASTTFRGRGLRILRVRRVLVGFPSKVPPGTVHAVGKHDLQVTTGDWDLLLEEVHPEGRRRMTGAEFVRGYRPRIGEGFGSADGPDPARVPGPEASPG